MNAQNVVEDEKMKTFCPECGFNIEVDEDGCCIDCGATAVGNAVDMLHKKGEITHRKETIFKLLNDFKYKKE